jgi:hypothetical protein
MKASRIPPVKVKAFYKNYRKERRFHAERRKAIIVYALRLKLYEKLLFSKAVDFVCDSLHYSLRGNGKIYISFVNGNHTSYH